MRKAMLTCLLILAVFAAAPAWGDALRLSVTTDLEASELLDVLTPEFKKNMGVDVQVNPGNLGTVIQEALQYRHLPDWSRKSLHYLTFLIRLYRYFSAPLAYPCFS